MSQARIVVVDDDSAAAAELHQRLTRLGYAVAGVASTAEQALPLAERLRPDLVLLALPLAAPADAVAIAERLRATLRVPVVYLAAHADEATLGRAPAADPFGYVFAPADEPRLAAVLDAALARRRAEEALGAAEARWAAPLRAAGDALLATDAEALVTVMNPAAESLTGWPCAEAVGRPLAETLRLLDEQSRQGVEDPAAAALRRAARVTPARPTLLIGREGRERPVQYVATPVRDNAAQVLGAVVVLRDVTEQRAQDAQLRQVEKMEAVGQLAGGIAHEFNNLLTVVNGYSSLLLTGTTPDHPWHGFVAEIHKAGERAADLTRQLLASSRRQMLQPRVLDVNQVVAAMATVLRRSLGAGNELVTELGADLPPVKSDPGQLEQALVALATNARDAMPAGGTLTVATACIALADADAVAHPGIPPGVYVCVRVRDTGVGMDEATQARVFEPFFTTKPAGKGTGLGLASVYGFVAQSGGHMEVASAPSQGACFSIYLPPAREEGSEQGLSLPGLPHGTETILMVEDEEGVRALNLQVLRLCGYTVLEAGHAVEALKVSAQYAGVLDLLVTDVVMAEMNGRHLAELLAVQRPGLKVLFLSDYGGTLSGQTGGAAAAAFLTKPYSPGELARRVRELLDG